MKLIDDGGEALAPIRDDCSVNRGGGIVQNNVKHNDIQGHRTFRGMTTETTKSFASTIRMTLLLMLISFIMEMIYIIVPLTTEANEVFWKTILVVGWDAQLRQMRRSYRPTVTVS